MKNIHKPCRIRIGIREDRGLLSFECETHGFTLFGSVHHRCYDAIQAAKVRVARKLGFTTFAEVVRS